MRRGAKRNAAWRGVVVDNSPPENQWLSGEVWGPLLDPLCGAARCVASSGAGWCRVVVGVSPPGNQWLGGGVWGLA